MKKENNTFSFPSWFFFFKFSQRRFQKTHRLCHEEASILSTEWTETPTCHSSEPFLLRRQSKKLRFLEAPGSVSVWRGEGRTSESILWIVESNGLLKENRTRELFASIQCFKGLKVAPREYFSPPAPSHPTLDFKLRGYQPGSAALPSLKCQNLTSTEHSSNTSLLKAVLIVGTADSHQMLMYVEFTYKSPFI